MSNDQEWKEKTKELQALVLDALSKNPVFVEMMSAPSCDCDREMRQAFRVAELIKQDCNERGTDRVTMADIRRVRCKMWGIE